MATDLLFFFVTAIILVISQTHLTKAHLRNKGQPKPVVATSLFYVIVIPVSEQLFSKVLS